MAALGHVAEQMTPTLQDLNAASGQLNRFFRLLGPFADASRPAVRALGDASVTGDQAAKAATPTISLLQQFAHPTPELSNNLRIALQHIDNRQYAVESDPHSPTGQGFTGLEALLRYVFTQVMAINIFDQNHYILKVSLFFDPNCSPYADAAFVQSHPDAAKKCSTAMGRSAPGISTPDPSGSAAAHSAGTNAPSSSPPAGGGQSMVAQLPQVSTPASGGAGAQAGRTAGAVLSYLLGP
jgi:hypothetical protein